MVLVKKVNFPPFFFALVKIRHFNLFDNILDRKKPFKTI